LSDIVNLEIVGVRAADEGEGIDNQRPWKEMMQCVLGTGRAVEVAAEGFSMGGGFAPGGRVVVKAATGVWWGCGSVVVFERHGCWVAHRVVWRCPVPRWSGRVCATRGDGRLWIDRPLVKAEELVGVVVGVVHEGSIVDLTRIGKRLEGVWIVIRGLMAMVAAKVFP
jgi:hypothetical protein